MLKHVPNALTIIRFLLIPIIAYLVQAFFNISTIGVAPIFWFLLGLIQNEDFKNKLSFQPLLKDKT